MLLALLRGPISDTLHVSPRVHVQNERTADRLDLLLSRKGACHEFSAARKARRAQRAPDLLLLFMINHTQHGMFARLWTGKTFLANFGPLITTALASTLRHLRRCVSTANSWLAGRTRQSRDRPW